MNWTNQPVGTARSAITERTAAAIDAGLRQYMLAIYSYMAAGLLLSGLTAYLVANTILGSAFLCRSRATHRTGLGRRICAPWLDIDRVSCRTSLVGASNQVNLLGPHRTTGSQSRRIATNLHWPECDADVFRRGCRLRWAELVGIQTRRDLSGMSSFLMMGLIGILIAGLANIFLASSAIQFSINVIGVLVFAGLTAYDTQRLKEEYLADMDQQAVAKSQIFGALSLYLNFINLFQFLLSFFGERRD